MKEKLLRVLRLVAYPAFYLFCLVVFGYMTFPYERLKHVILAEFARTSSVSASPRRLEIAELSPYWLTGVEVHGARLHTRGEPEEPGQPAKETTIEIERATARAQLLPLLLGDVRVAFSARVFGGEIAGVLPVEGGDHVEIELEEIDLGKTPLVELAGIPLTGKANARVELELPEGKLSKANGTVSLTAADVAAGDGKAKLLGQLALPTVSLGELELEVEVQDGVAKLEKGGASGKDLELLLEGKVALRDTFADSAADLHLRFKLADAYRNKNDVTRGLFGAPGTNAPALFELADPKIKRAKRADGFYGFHVTGTLKRPRFDASPVEGAAPGKARMKPGRPSPLLGGKPMESEPPGKE